MWACLIIDLARLKYYNFFIAKPQNVSTSRHELSSLKRSIFCYSCICKYSKCSIRTGDKLPSGVWIMSSIFSQSQLFATLMKYLFFFPLCLPIPTAQWWGENWLHSAARPQRPLLQASVNICARAPLLSFGNCVYVAALGGYSPLFHPSVSTAQIMQSMFKT